MGLSFQRRLNRAARAIAGTTNERRRDAVSAFLREAMIALLVG
jgi:hypothetical protein